MDIKEDKWEQAAYENIDKYLHRGKDGKGNEPQLLGGSNLLNTIGIAMGFPFCDPTKWTETELDQASRGELVFFDGKSLEAINVIAGAIRGRCNGDDNCLVTIVPIELYAEEKLYETPVFKIQRYHHSKVVYVDNVGRYYDDFDDWFRHNRLPASKMIFPQKLELQSDGNHALVSAPYDTPAASVGENVAEGVDIAAGIIGIGSAVGLMIISGPAAPFLAIAGIATAIWGTGRAVSDLVDRAGHGQSVNPFTDESARLLWLGIAASIAGFGAMGATMRLSSVAARGLQISNALKIMTNLANGVSVTLNTSAIVNNSIYLISHIKEMSIGDILLNVALIAFWTKGTFSCKSANAIIKDVHNQAFSLISDELPLESREEFIKLRNRLNNDSDLLNLFSNASKSNIPIRQYSEFLVDCMGYYDAVTTLSPEQIEALSNLRNFVNDDLQLLVGLQTITEATEANREEALKIILSLWERYSAGNVPQTDDVHLINNNLVIGHAPPIKLTELRRVTPSLITFVGERLSKMDTVAIHEWSIQELVSLQDQGLFTTCPVTGIRKAGYAIVELNGQLTISLKKLQSLPPETCGKLIETIGKNNASSEIPKPVKKFIVSDLRLRFEVQRKESVEWALKSVAEWTNLTDIVKSDLMPYEQDRLFTFQAEVGMSKADMYMPDMMKFVSERNPKNVSEMVAYSEFVMTYMDETVSSVLKSLQDGTLQLPINTKKSVWLREQAKLKVFPNTGAMEEKLNEFMTIADKNDMFGIKLVNKGLSDDDLVTAIRTLRLRFGGKVSATYHIYKHATEPPSAYIDQANITTQSPSSEYTVSIGQEGDSRIISFKDTNGGAIVLEKDGRVLLCSFRATGRK